MKNKILFVLHRIGIGGSMTSLLNLLELLKSDGVDCDLFLMDHTGSFLERAKNAANLLPENKRLASIICNKEKLKRNKDIVGLAYRISYVLKSKLTKRKYNYDSIYQKEAKKSLPRMLRSVCRVYSCRIYRRYRLGKGRASCDKAI